VNNIYYFLFVCAAVTFGFDSGNAHAVSNKPNIVIMMADNLG